MTVPPQARDPRDIDPAASGSWPGNELEETLAAALGAADAGGRLLEVLGRSSFWVPLPEGGGPDSQDLALPTVQFSGAPYVPVYSSREQFEACVRMEMPFAVVSAREFARGLPPQVGIAVNPEGAVGVPLPPEAVAELCREGGADELTGVRGGARMRLFEPDWQDDPVDFLAAAGEEFAQLARVRTARRGLASAEGDPPALFVGVELDVLEPESRQLAHDALARALHRAPVRWPVQLVLLDAAQDPVVDWMRACVRPFYERQTASASPGAAGAGV
ncbi:enhanced serine sensitivity protein SseB [Streptomyces alkaliterrae]|uniref:Enhanced serine sensitivity protein SseB n=1 Tax=Streptomyces alkaliterrae TaxID=2213162 RepID=A0A5P0YPL0_9ACTN|nr:enhanced serine sensitivity protein SseB [Streptomyces alkaliterrae]MBB1255413.1 enhanced serine sensitivity protein SseB [Streptomyces alkaliterrae]MBB1258704.1 enhanced serine sensitivity protein SseB [Streptomyces alkaliterrae]MQS02188.1 enhanced serine sensitivity protein SseB [Streptomyces alkaliterrae]